MMKIFWIWDDKMKNEAEMKMMMEKLVDAIPFTYIVKKVNESDNRSLLDHLTFIF